ncbi:MAG: competence/damage-inducible protein A [Gammaproteobacteria bacterium]
MSFNLDHNPSAAVLIIGNEILSGRTEDQNLNFIASKLSSLNIRVQYAAFIPDKIEVIIEEVQRASKRFNYVFTTGGIGPTHDDITTDAVAQALGLEVIEDPKAALWLERHYGGKDNLTEARLRMARVPKGAGLILNPVSAAPGYKIENVFVLAGVPLIMRSMFDDVQRFLIPGQTIYSLTLRCSTGESKIAQLLSQLQTEFPEVEIGSYPHFRLSGYGLSLVLKSLDQDKIHLLAKKIQTMISSFGDTAEVLLD